MKRLFVLLCALIMGCVASAAPSNAVVGAQWSSNAQGSIAQSYGSVGGYDWIGWGASGHANSSPPGVCDVLPANHYVSIQIIKNTYTHVSSINKRVPNNGCLSWDYDDFGTFRVAWSDTWYVRIVEQTTLWVRTDNR